MIIIDIQSIWNDIKIDAITSLIMLVQMYNVVRLLYIYDFSDATAAAAFLAIMYWLGHWAKDYQIDSTEATNG